MFPIRDDVPSRATPWVVIVLAVLCGLVFYREVRLASEAPRHRFEQARESAGLDALLARCALVPERVARPLVDPGLWIREPGKTFGRSALPLLTSLFLHAGVGHLLANLWFLWVFGRSVEGRLGAGRFLALYVGTGLLAGLLHVGFMAYSQSLEDYAATLRAGGVPAPLDGLGDRLAILANEPARLFRGVPAFPDSQIPTIGASGAVSGVLGAHVVLFPKARVLTFVPPLVFLLFQIPAVLFVGMWLLTQVFGLWDALEARLFEDLGGIAHGAHLGGFASGLVLGLALRAGRGAGIPARESAE